MTHTPDERPDPDPADGEPRPVSPPVPLGGDTLGPAPAGSDPADRDDGDRYVPV